MTGHKNWRDMKHKGDPEHAAELGRKMEEEILNKELKDLLESFQDYCSHQSWRCEYRTRYEKCVCGLDELCDKLGIDRVEPNDPEKES